MDPSISVYNLAILPATIEEFDLDFLVYTLPGPWANTTHARFQRAF